MATFSLGTDFTSALRQPSYVNGRLLLAADLSSDQATLRARDQWIGEAAGSGVVRGLSVTSSATTLTVAPGLGINRAGEPIVLTTDATMALAVPLAEVSPANPAKFRCCDPGSSGDTQVIVDSGSYVLTARPASRAEGSTASAPAPGGATSSGCVAAWTVAGVEFRVTTLPLPSSVSGISVTGPNRRNLIAGSCYGVGPLADLPVDPFGFDQAFGLDLLSDLTDDDLPLATFSWSGQSVNDLDSWSARRRIVTPEPGSGSWSVLTADRRIADGQARFAQFQDQAEELVATQVADQTTAWETFPLLPPVGFLPVDDGDLKSVTTRLAEIRDADDEAPEDEEEREHPERRSLRETAERDLEVLLAAASAVNGPGFSLRTFFGGLARFGGIIAWEMAELLLRESWYRPPVVVSEPRFIPDDRLRPAATDVIDVDGGRDVFGRPDLSERISYYFVLENVLALGELAGKRRTRKSRLARIEASRSNLYVVFVANYLWLGQSRPPVLPIGSFVHKPTPQIPGQIPR
jgi:hypothetical protein